MKIYLYSGVQRLKRESNVGRAVCQQQFAVKENGMSFACSLHDADVVHINTIFLKSFLLAYRAKKQNIPVVYHVNFTEENQNETWWSLKFTYIFLKQWRAICYNMGTLVIAPTLYSKKCLESYGVHKEIGVVPSGIDLLYYDKKNVEKNSFRKKYGYDIQDKIIMSVGLSTSQKGLEDFVELARRMPEYQFLWFGCKIQSLQEKIPNLHFIENRKQNALREAYGCCDLFLHPAREEMEGNAVLEALAMKIPVLLRNIPVYMDWLEDNTEVYKATDVDSFEKKITCILNGNNTSLVETGHAVAEKWTIEFVSAQIRDIYKKAIYLNMKEKGKNYDGDKK